MKRWIVAIVVALALGAVAQATDWTAIVLTDGEIVEVSAMRNNIGLWAAWHEQNAEEIYGAGVIGLLEVAPNAELPLRKFLPGLGDWMDLPETITANIAIGLKPGVVNLMHSPDAMVAPFVQVASGALIVRAEYAWVEGGGMDGLAESEFKLFGGLCVCW